MDKMVKSFLRGYAVYPRIVKLMTTVYVGFSDTRMTGKQREEQSPSVRSVGPLRR